MDPTPATSGRGAVAPLPKWSFHGIPSPAIPSPGIGSPQAFARSTLSPRSLSPFRRAVAVAEVPSSALPQHATPPIGMRAAAAHPRLASPLPGAHPRLASPLPNWRALSPSRPVHAAPIQVAPNPGTASTAMTLQNLPMFAFGASAGLHPGSPLASPQPPLPRHTMPPVALASPAPQVRPAALPQRRQLAREFSGPQMETGPHDGSVGEGQSSEKDIRAAWNSTDQVIKQLAAALKNLEADVAGLRQENKSLRESMGQAPPGSGSQQQTESQSQLTKPPSAQLEAPLSHSSESAQQHEHASALPTNSAANPSPQVQETPLQQDVHAAGRNVPARISPVGSQNSPVGAFSNGGSPTPPTSRADIHSSTATILGPNSLVVPEDEQPASPREPTRAMAVHVEPVGAPSTKVAKTPDSPRVKRPEDITDRPPSPWSPESVLRDVQERLRVGDLDGAEELLQGGGGLRDLGSGGAAVVDTLAAALRERGEDAKAESWIDNALDSDLLPNDQSLELAMTSACQRGNPQQAENLMCKMMRRKTPPKSVFNLVIRMFVEIQDALKVEHWLLKAGQSGWTPEQGAFDAVVSLFAEKDAIKAEEWLSRALRTDYRLPDACFEAVVQAFLRMGDVAKANEWLSRAHADKRLPSDAILRVAARMSMDVGNLVHAEAWLTLLVAHGDSSVDMLRREFFDAALQAGDTTCAERQLAALGGPEPDRTQRLVVAYAEQGQAARSKAVLERYCALGGLLTPEISSSVLSACATVGDAEGTEAAARALAASSQGHGPPLNSAQVAMLWRALGDERAIGLLSELGYHADTAVFEASADVASGVPYDTVDAAAGTPVDTQLNSAAPHDRRSAANNRVAPQERRDADLRKFRKPPGTTSSPRVGNTRSRVPSTLSKSSASSRR